MQRKGDYHRAACWPLALVSLLGLRLGRSNVWTKEITSRMETRQPREIFSHKEKERNPNLVLSWGRSSSRKDAFLLDHFLPSPNSDAPPEANFPTRICSFVYEFRSFCNHSLFSPNQGVRITSLLRKRILSRARQVKCIKLIMSSNSEVPSSKPTFLTSL